VADNYEIRLCRRVAAQRGEEGGEAGGRCAGWRCGGGRRKSNGDGGSSGEGRRRSTSRSGVVCEMEGEEEAVRLCRWAPPAQRTHLMKNQSDAKSYGVSSLLFAERSRVGVVFRKRTVRTTSPPPMSEDCSRTPSKISDSPSALSRTRDGFSANVRISARRSIALWESVGGGVWGGWEW
jgi:hypothetical protein